jgi:hypothetical protein
MVWGGVGVGRRSAEVAQTMYLHVSKCKNDKIKERKKIWCLSAKCLLQKDSSLSVLVLEYYLFVYIIH